MPLSSLESLLVVEGLMGIPDRKRSFDSLRLPPGRAEIGSFVFCGWDMDVLLLRPSLGVPSLLWVAGFNDELTEVAKICVHGQHGLNALKHQKCSLLLALRHPFHKN